MECDGIEKSGAQGEERSGGSRRGLVPQQQSAPVEKRPREGGWRVETDSMAMVDGVTRGLGWTVSSPPLLWWGHTWGGEENEKEEEGASCHPRTVHRCMRGVETGGGKWNTIRCISTGSCGGFSSATGARAWVSTHCF